MTRVRLADPRSILVAALVLVAVGAAAQAAPNAVVERHEMTVTLAPESHAISVRNRMTVRGPEVVFSLAGTLRLNLGACRVDGRPAEGAIAPLPVPPPFAGKTSAARYRVRFDRGARHTLELVYKGTIHDPVRKASDVAFVVGDHTTGLIGPEGVFLAPSSLWYPVVEGAMPRFDLTVTVPAPWRTITQGSLVKEATEGGHSVSVWKSPLPSDGLYLQAGKYHVVRRQHRNVSCGVALLKPDPAVETLVLDEMARYLDLYVPLLGPYPHRRFDLVENFFSSGYGMPGYTLLGGDVIRVMTMLARRTGKIRPGFLDHELMHGWWGNGVYLDYAKGNWCEGLTSYLTNYYRKEVEEPETAAEHRRRISQAYSIKVRPEDDYPVRKFTGKTEDVDNDVGYGKASMIFHMVRREIGDKAFWGALRDVAMRFRGKKASWADFETAFERASRKDLTAFFATWLDRTGGPVLALGGFGGPIVPGGRSVSNRITGEIVQTGEPWPLTVDVAVVLGEKEKRISVPLKGARTKFSVDVTDIAPRKRIALPEVTLDPDAHVFRLLPPAAIPACLRATIEDREKVIVHPDGVAAYAAMAKRAAGDKGGTILPVSRARLENVANRSLLLFGGPWENPLVKALLAEGPEGVVIRRNHIELPLRDPAEHTMKPATSLLLSFRNPRAPDRFVTVFFTLNRIDLDRPPRIFHYGWDGYVLFGGSRPVARGRVDEPDDPAVWSPEIAATGESEHAAKPLIDALCDPALEGRGAGTEGARKAEAIVAREFYLAGLEVRRQPFSFDVLDTTPGDLHVRSGRKTKVLKNAFLPYPWCRDTKGAETLTIAEIRAKKGQVDAWPADDPRTGWGALTYPSHLPASAKARLGKARSAGEPANAWRFASGAQARGWEWPRMPTGLALAVQPRILEGLGEQTPVTFSVAMKRRTIEGANVLGVRVGREPQRRPVLVGAHYDGLGKDGDRVFVCADDNVSGVVALVLAAREIAAGDAPKRNVIFAAFDAEEWGLRGSRAHVNPLRWKNRSYAAMVNLDTVGRRGVNDVYVIGRSKHPKLANAAMQELARAGFGTGKDIDRFAFPHGSDHWPFHLTGTPSIDLWSSDYKIMNSSRDVPEDVDPAKITNLAKALANLIRRLANE